MDWDNLNISLLNRQWGKYHLISSSTHALNPEGKHRVTHLIHNVSFFTLIVEKIHHLFEQSRADL